MHAIPYIVPYIPSHGTVPYIPSLATWLANTSAYEYLYRYYRSKRGGAGGPDANATAATHTQNADRGRAKQRNGTDPNNYIVYTEYAEESINAYMTESVYKCAQFESNYFSLDECQFAHPLHLLFQRASQQAMRGWKSSLVAARADAQESRRRAGGDGFADGFADGLDQGAARVRSRDVAAELARQARLYMQLSMEQELRCNQYAGAAQLFASCKEELRRTIATTKDSIHARMGCVGRAAARFRPAMYQCDT